MDWNYYIGFTTYLFALTNPIGVLPLFLSYTEGIKKAERLHILNITVLTVVAILCVSLLLGTHILNFFSISVDDFRIAGGLLLLFIAFNMFQARRGRTVHTPEEDKEAKEERESIAITPLATPMLIGPGEMTVLITYSNDASGWKAMGLLLLGCLIVAVLVYVVLRMADPIGRKLGTTGINVTTRLMALIVAAIAVNFIITGIKNSFGIGV
tara:strand:- start:131 stop:763 length:633 start_codon:yes stop_codon:yes gene_type:complete